jgi:hypothetical protein
LRRPRGRHTGRRQPRRGHRHEGRRLRDQAPRAGAGHRERNGHRARDAHRHELAHRERPEIEPPLVQRLLKRAGRADRHERGGHPQIRREPRHAEPCFDARGEREQHGREHDGHADRERERPFEIVVGERGALDHRIAEAAFGDHQHQRQRQRDRRGKADVGRTEPARDQQIRDERDELAAPGLHQRPREAAHGARTEPLAAAAPACA